MFTEMHCDEFTDESEFKPALLMETWDEWYEEEEGNSYLEELLSKWTKMF